MYKKNKREMFKLNNRGFAITSIIYSMLLLFIILMTLIILTLGRKKVMLDKSKNETLEFFSQLDSYPCSVTEKNSNEITIGVGDVVTCKTESFYVIENDGTNIKMLAKYNLNVGDNKVSSDTEGIQSFNAPGFVTGGTEPYFGTVVFSNTNYWNSTTNYPAFVYNNNSTLYQYIENYAGYLKNLLKTTDINASLISYEEMIGLGCNATNNSCANAPEWLHLVSYWIGSAYNTTNMWGMNSNGSFSNAQYSSNNVYGVRPLVTVPINIVKNTMLDVVKTGPTAEDPPDGESGYTGVLKIVYLDPTDLTKYCDASNVNSETETKTGCMKWYAYADDGTNYIMILDHNTTATKAWNSSGNNSEGPVIANAQLKDDTTGWNNSLNPRLITANEIATITGNTSWTTSSSWFYLDSNTTTQIAKSQGSSKYVWLFDYTYDCTSYGCNIADSSTYGYWTSSAHSSNSSRAWLVNCGGRSNYSDVANTNLGIRPVITVQKSVFD